MMTTKQEKNRTNKCGIYSIIRNLQAPFPLCLGC